MPGRAVREGNHATSKGGGMVAACGSGTGKHHPTGKKPADKNSLKNRGFYQSKAWRRVRQLALHRDHYLCQECLKEKRITNATEVHHLKPLESHPELGLELANLESLCWDCHEATKPRRREDSLPVRIIKM